MAKCVASGFRVTDSAGQERFRCAFSGLSAPEPAQDGSLSLPWPEVPVHTYSPPPEPFASVANFPFATLRALEGLLTASASSLTSHLFLL